MSERTSLSRTHQTARNGSMSRATIRDFDDKHLMQQITKADVYHSESPSDVERFQMVGLTSVPLKQKEDKNQQNQQNQKQQGQGGSGDEDGQDWDHNQPQGESAEALILYGNGQRSHPVALVDDRRVRPYAMKPGETALYAASGTGQMVFHNDEGSSLIAVDNPAEQSESEETKERYASLRHVEKSKQSREIKEGQEVQEHKHEGESVNLEVRVTKGKISFLAGEEEVGYYDKGSATWCFKGRILLGDDTGDMKEVHRKLDLDDAGNKAMTHAKKVFAV